MKRRDVVAFGTQEQTLKILNQGTKILIAVPVVLKRVAGQIQVVAANQIVNKSKFNTN